MTASEINQRFNTIYNGQMNFMTPDLIARGKRGKMIWELSTGEGFGGQSVYGVTVIELPSAKRHDLSELFLTEADARAYISNDFVEA